MADLQPKKGSDCLRATVSGNAFARSAPVLQVQYLNKRSEYHVLAVGTNTLGRMPDNDIVVLGPFVSRQHCAFIVSPNGHCFIRDLGSTHGVNVNGKRITDLTPLKYGDEIVVGGPRLVLLSPEEGA